MVLPIALAQLYHHNFHHVLIASCLGITPSAFLLAFFLAFLALLTAFFALLLAFLAMFLASPMFLFALYSILHDLCFQKGHEVVARILLCSSGVAVPKGSRTSVFALLTCTERPCPFISRSLYRTGAHTLHLATHAHRRHRLGVPGY